MPAYVPLVFSLLLLLPGTAVADTWSSYEPGYGHLIHQDPYVKIYDNTGARPSVRRTTRERKREAYYRQQQRPFTFERSHCYFPVSRHVPKCYVYDDCTYDELYGDGYWEQCDDRRERFNAPGRRAEHQRDTLSPGPRHRERPYPYYTRDRYEYQNSHRHYDSYWQDDVYGTVNTYEWYDY